MKPRKKSEHKVEAKTKEAPKGAVAAPAAPPVKVAKLKVLKKDTKYRGAREAWHARLLEFDGKTEAEFIESTKEKPPALTRNGTAENPMGWVRFFVREGVLSVSA